MGSEAPDNAPATPEEAKAETPEPKNPASKWFTHDWNRVIAVSKLPMLRPATTIVALMPILQQLSDRVPISVENAWLLWYSSLSFAVTFIIVRFQAPGFIQDFADYSAYKSQGHSHRWLLWRLKFALHTAHDRDDLLGELIRKDLGIPYVSLTDAQKERFKNPPEWPENGKSVGEEKLGYIDELFPAGRDMCLYFWKGDVRHILPIEETGDPCGYRQKELFWIIYTDQAKARPRWRATAWVFIYLAFLLLGLSFINNVWKVAHNAIWGG